jgi:hypothetical protein
MRHMKFTDGAQMGATCKTYMGPTWAIPRYPSLPRWVPPVCQWCKNRMGPRWVKWFAKMGPIMTTLMAQLPPIWAPFVLLDCHVNCIKMVQITKYSRKIKISWQELSFMHRIGLCGMACIYSDDHLEIQYGGHMTSSPLAPFDWPDPKT